MTNEVMAAAIQAGESSSIVKFAAAARQQVNQTAAESIELIKQRNRKRNKERYGCPDCVAAQCYTTCPRYLTNAEPEELWRWWAASKPPDIRVTEPLLALQAPVAKKGGSKSGGRLRHKKLKIYSNPYFSI